MKLKHIEIALFAAFILAVTVSMMNFENDCKGIRNDVLRLHVIANSDDISDQQLKLKVRDAVLEKGRDIFGQSDNKQAAETKAKIGISVLEETAKNIILQNGYNYDVKVEIGKSRFPTKTYENITLPAGEYDAVRVIIGKGEGKNWWCVMFPPLCLPAAEGDKKIDDVLNEDQLKLVQSNPKYEIRFWVVEKIEELKLRLGNRGQ